MGLLQTAIVFYILSYIMWIYIDLYWDLFITYVFLYKLKIITNQRAKEKVLTYFFKGINQKEFEKLASAFL